MFDDHPSDEEEARNNHHHAIEKLNRDGFLVADSSEWDEGLDLVDEDGFPVPPDPNELDHIFERVERCHKNSKLEDSNMSGMFEVSFSEDLAEEVQECNDDVVQIDNTGESQFSIQEGSASRSIEKEVDTDVKHKDKELSRATVIEVFQFGRGSKKWYSLLPGLTCAAISGCIYPAVAFVLSNTFRVLSAPTSDEFREDIKQMAFTFMLLGVIGFVSVMTQVTLLETAAEEMTYSLKIEWFAALLRQDMAYFDSHDMSGTALEISASCTRYKDGVGRKLGEGVQFFFTFVGGFAYAFYCSWSTSLVLLGVVPFMSSSILFLMKTTQSQSKRSNECYSEAGSIALTAASAIRTVNALNATQIFIKKYCDATQNAYRAAANNVVMLGLANGMVLGTVIFLRCGVLTLFGAYLLYSQVRNDGCDPSGALENLNTSCEPDGQNIMGALIGMTLGAAGIPQFSLAVQAFTNARTACFPAVSLMERNLDTECKLHQKKAAAPPTLVTSIAKSREIVSLPTEVVSAASLNFDNICFDNVCFSYPARPDALVLDSFSFSVKSGQTVGIVGPSGSGKSTVLSILERLYDPISGSITIDGVDIRDIDVSSLRETIGFVNQEPKLFATSIRNNIAYGCPGATDTQIEEAAKLANAHDFIASFPFGYETNVGELGAQLSGGQRQRIALARVLVKKRKLLLLDEFSSALDSESEMIIQESLNKVLKDSSMTTLIVAHRLSTVQNADCIVVLCDGKVVETGTHENLLARKALYYTLVQAQKQGRQPQESPSFTSFARLFDEIHSSSGSSKFHYRTGVEVALNLSTKPKREVTLALAKRGEVSVTDKNQFVGDSQNVVETPQIQFRNVHFHYPTRPDNEVLRGFDLTVKKGETLALVGESGGGKSTIIALLERYYDATEGSILINGVDIKDLNVEWLRAQIGLVSQEPVLFNATIRENMLYGHPTASEKEIEEACRRANAHDFICQFPQKYDTFVGEGGSQLISGGQKQRIAIARAILKNHSILLLDEASSSLDTKSEQLVQDALHKIMTPKSQTTIVIAHRLSTVRNADRIAVIAGGVLCEIGTWDQLLTRPDGRFRRMSLFQSLDGHKQEVNSIQAQAQMEFDSGREHDNTQDIGMDHATTELSIKATNISKRARLLARDDRYYLAVGSSGAIIAGVGFPATGVLFGYLVELLYHPVPGCDSSNQPSCDSIASDMQATSFYITLAWVGVLVCSFTGNILLYYGFGIASERMNKRVRDAMFKSLLLQEVAYFDTHNISSLTSQLQDDAAVLHAFIGEPLRTLITAISSLLIGILTSLYFMWPVALLAFCFVPALAFVAKSRMNNIMIAEKDEKTGINDLGSPDAIAVETLINMRTIASLNIEEVKKKEYSNALRNNQSSVVTVCKKGATGGSAIFIQFWVLALLYWWGGFLLSTYPDTWEFQDFLIAIFALVVSISGSFIGSSGTMDKKAAEEAAARILSLIDRTSAIDPLSETGKKGD